MADLVQSFAPPTYWQQFEDLTLGMAQSFFSDATAQKIGRPGLSQDGLDVLAWGRIGQVGIQCKRREALDANNDLRAGGAVTIDDLKAAVLKAEAFKTPFKLFILATTAKAETTLQADVASLSASRVANGQSRVQVWSWQDYEAQLNHDWRLQGRYYESVQQGLSPRERNLVTLSVFADAFSRAAFRDPLSCEHPDRFMQAIEATQRALSLGELFDRDGQHVRTAIGGFRKLSDPALVQAMSAVDQQLSHFRGEFLRAKHARAIIEHPDFLEIPDHRMKQELEDQRARTVELLDAALTLAGLTPLGYGRPHPRS
jgi:hypothetical protein